MKLFKITALDSIIYNAIPVNLRPPPHLALIKFPDGFDTDMA